MTKSVGIDGCKSGWFFFQKEGEEITFGVEESISTLCDSLPDNSKVCTDTPTGLIDQGPAGRVCDVEARKLLGRAKAPSVFPAPCRSVLQARTFEEAKALSAQAIGRKLSKQAYAITAKIREVDEFLRSRNRKFR